jgi:hypothetical protein
MYHYLLREIQEFCQIFTTQIVRNVVANKKINTAYRTNISRIQTFSGNPKLANINNRYELNMWCASIPANIPST